MSRTGGGEWILRRICGNEVREEVQWRSATAAEGYCGDDEMWVMAMMIHRRQRRRRSGNNGDGEP